MGIYPANAMLNALVGLPIGLPPLEGAVSRDDVLACATEIRKSVGTLRDPGLIKAMAAEIGKIQSQATWDRTIGIMGWKESVLFVNNTRRWVSRCTGVNRR